MLKVLHVEAEAVRQAVSLQRQLTGRLAAALLRASGPMGVACRGRPPQKEQTKGELYANALGDVGCRSLPVDADGGQGR
jgi:hypothetical protein